MMRSLNNRGFYDQYIDSIKKELESLEIRIRNIKESRYHLITLIQKRNFDDAYVKFSDEKTSVEYLAYLEKVKFNQKIYKFEKCSVIYNNGEEYEHGAFLRSILHNITKYNREICRLEDEYEELKKYNISSDLHKEILKAYDYLLTGYLIDGNIYSMGCNMGNLYIKRKKNTYRRKIIDFGKSYKERQRVIDEGLIPYRKKDEEEAAAKGEEYNGVKWLLYRFTDYNYWLEWHHKDEAFPNIDVYSFAPSMFNNDRRPSDKIKESVEFKNILDLKVGFVQKMHIAIELNEHQSEIYNREQNPLIVKL